MELSEIPLIVSAVAVNTLMDTEMFPVFDGLECMTTIRAL